SIVEPLTSSKGFSSIHAAKMQNEALEATISELNEEDIPGSSGEAQTSLPTTFDQQISENCDIPSQEPLEGEEHISPEAVIPSERTHSEAPHIVVKEVKSCNHESSSTKSLSKNNCKSKSQNMVPKNICDSVVVPKTNSQEKQEGHHRTRHSRARSKSPLPPVHTAQMNHISYASEMELQVGAIITRTGNNHDTRNHALPDGNYKLFSKNSSGGRCANDDKPFTQTPDFPLGPKTESSLGSSVPSAPFPSMLCQNKVFQQLGMSSSTRDHTRTPTSSLGTWGEPLPCLQQQEMGGMRPTALRGVTAECQVHPHTQDPPSPTESTML
ncbi:hypothetical protein OTU49_008436, partial [Cherax quadricarinatus]